MCLIWGWGGGANNIPLSVFFLYNFLLTSLPCISALLCLIIMKFHMSFRYRPTLDLCLNFIKIEWVLTSLRHHLSFLLTIVHNPNSIETTNFVLGTNTQQPSIILIIKMNVTLTDDEGHRQRSKVTKKK